MDQWVFTCQRSRAQASGADPGPKTGTTECSASPTGGVHPLWLYMYLHIFYALSLHSAKAGPGWSHDKCQHELCGFGPR